MYLVEPTLNKSEDQGSKPRLRCKVFLVLDSSLFCVDMFFQQAILSPQEKNGQRLQCLKEREGRQTSVKEVMMWEEKIDMLRTKYTN